MQTLISLQFPINKMVRIFRWNYIIIIFLLLANLFKDFLKTYSPEKGKNLATKEDIEEITEKIESVIINNGTLPKIFF